MNSRDAAITDSGYQCPICGEAQMHYLFEIHGSTVAACTGCGLTYSRSHRSRDDTPAPQDRPESDRLDARPESRTEIDASRRYLDILMERLGNGSKVLLVGRPTHSFVGLAAQRGLQVVSRMDMSEFESGITVKHPLDAVVFLYQLEKCLSLRRVLDQTYAIMKPGAVLLLVTPSLDSRSAHFFGGSWTEWRPENRYYFDNSTVQSLLLRHGFGELELQNDVRSYTLAHINDRATAFPGTWVTRLIRLFYRLLPASLHGLYFRLPSSGIIVSARKTERRERPLLTIVLPVYNESATFPTLLKQLVARQMDGLEREIIIVESNSTDGSRQLVMQHAGQAGIAVILQDKPRGKGHAVRQGLAQAKGDIVLIQDADLEYDLNDYEALLQPILTFKRAFVLGSRHGGRWKMRHFSDQAQLSAYFNFGHVIFTALLNLLYGQHMKDPFTMFKVFRRDCLHNVKLECDRFDFDFELVIKLLRKGYSPSEIPVNYDSRSFKQGKKIRMLRDPVTWIIALFKYRFASIYSRQAGGFR